MTPGAPWADIVLFLAIFVLALGVRLLYLFQIESIPLFYHLAGDARSYDAWAQRIASGDWLGDSVFYQAPLYPYFLGLLQAVVGHNLWLSRVTQMMLGSASCAILYWAGKSFFSRGAGIAAGCIMALYAPAIFYESLIQKTVLDVFLITLLLCLLGRVQSTARRSHWLALGCVLGLLGLNRENALIWLFILPLWIWFYFVAAPLRTRLAWIIFFLGGAMLILFPVGLRNLTIGGEFTLTTSQLGPNFFIGNNAAADGTYLPLREGRGDPQFERQDATELAQQALGRTPSPGEVSGYWLGRSFDYIRSQPIAWLRLMGKKWMMVWNVRELEDTDDFYLYLEWSSFLGALAWISHFGVLAALAAGGAFLTWRRWRELSSLYLLLGTLAITMSLFYVFGRYRFPMVPLLALFAGAGLTEGFKICRNHEIRRGLEWGAVMALAAVLVRWPVIGESKPSAAGYNNLANALVKQGRFEEARENYQHAIQVNPNYAEARYNLGNLFARQGHLDQAKVQYQEAVRVSPDFAEAHNNLGEVLMRRDELEGATRQFRLALEISPNQAEFHFNLATALAKRQQLEEAKAHFREALRQRPNFAAAYHQLGVIMAAQGHLSEASDLFRQALRAEPEYAEAYESLGEALAQQGKKAEAVPYLREALRLMELRRRGGAQGRS